MLTGEPFPKGEVSFVVLGEPATKSRARVVVKKGKAHAFTPAKTKAAEAAMRAAFLLAVGRLAPSALHGFAVEADFYMASGIRRDVDNMLKIVLDGLNKVAWGDDYQVVSLTGRKTTVPKGQERTEVRISVAGLLQARQALCEQCGGTFPRPPSHGAKKYCSGECRSAALLARRQRPCPGCGDTFAGPADQKHCSTDCSYRSRHQDVTCAKCGIAFTRAQSLARRGKSYCSDKCKPNAAKEIQ